MFEIATILNIRQKPFGPRFIIPTRSPNIVYAGKVLCACQLGKIIEGDENKYEHGPAMPNTAFDSVKPIYRLYVCTAYTVEKDIFFNIFLQNRGNGY